MENMYFVSQEQCNQFFALYKAYNDMLQSFMGSMPLNLDSYTGSTQNAPEGGIPTAYERPRVFMGTDANGKPIYKQISGKTQDERNENIVKAFIQSGHIWDLIPNPNVTACAAVKQSRTPVSEFAWDWFNRYKKGQISVSYEYQMGKRLEKIVACFEGKFIEDINTDDVMVFIEYGKNRNWAHSTFGDHITTMKQVFDYAVEKGLLAVNAINWKRIKNPGVEKHTRKAATVKQYEDILAHIPDLESPIEQLALSILAYTGMRPEELYGLRWEDIDLNSNRINIERATTFSRSNNTAVHKGTKTRTSKDWIPIPEGLRTILATHYKASGTVIHDENGNSFEKYGDTKIQLWDKIRERVNLHGQRPCEFRKTVASVMLAKGVDVKSVQRYLRHKKADITVNTYAECDPDALLNGCNQLNVTTA